MQESDALSRAVLNSMMANIAVVDRNGTIIAINEGWERFAQENGCDPASPKVGVGANYLEVCARAVRDLGAEGQKILDGIKGVLAHSQATFSHEYPCHSPTEQRWFAMRVSPLERADGGAVIAQFNITVSEQAKEALFRSQEMQQSVLNNTPARVFWKDRNLNYLGCNSAGARDAGLAAPHEIIGKSDFDLAWKGSADAYRADDLAVMESGIPRIGFEETMHRPDGTIGILITSKLPLHDRTGHVFGLVGTYEDITERKREEESLRRMATVVKDSNDAITIQDFEGRITAWNRGADLMYGFSEAEALEANIERLTTPAKVAEQKDFIRRLIAGEAITSFETQRVTKDGRVLDVWMTVTKLMDEAGNPVGLASTERDITERKRAEESLTKTLLLLKQSLRFTEALLSAIPTPVFYKDKEGRYLGCNPAFTEIMGVTAEDLKGKTAMELWPGEEARTYHAKDMELMIHPIRQVYEYRVRDKDGVVRPVIYAKDVFREENDQVTGIVGTFLDITERKAMDTKLLESLDRAEAGNRAKSEFLGIMSHELRTPLNGVLGSAELLTYTPLDEEQESLTATVSKCGEHLLAIVKDILDFSSMEAGKLAIEVAPMSVAEVIELSALAVKKSAADKRLAFRCEISRDVPNQIIGDELRIRQILINLLGNAVKFTASGSVDFRIAPDEEGRFLDFSVEDTGVGISSETIGLLFKPFTQVDSTTTRAFGGTGLGLAISKRLAEAMGSSITVASIPGKGSTFTFHFPLESAPVCAVGMASVPSHISDWERNKSVQTESCPPVQTDGTPPEGNLVLVVEDDPENSTLEGKMLRSLGYRAEFAADGAEAVQAFVPGKYSAILMDVVMPVMDGLEATKKIREIEAAVEGHVPIITLTANVMPGDRERYLATGADAFLSKPFKRGELADILVQAIAGER